MPSPNYTGDTAIGSDASIGLTTSETGIINEGMSYAHENESVWFRDRYSGRIGRANDHDAAVTYSLAGSVSAKNSGVNVATYVAAATIANEDYFASSSSTYNALSYSTSDTILDAVSGDQPAGDVRTVTLEYIRPRFYSVT